MRNNEIIFQRVRELAENNGVVVRDIFETESELICIDIDDSVSYKYLMELDNYLEQWNIIVISIDFNASSYVESGMKGLTIWIG